MLGLYLLLVALCCLPLRAESHSAPRLVLLLCDALTLDDVRDARAPHLRRMAEEGSVGLMNCDILTAKTPLESWLTLAKGEASRPVPLKVETVLLGNNRVLRGVPVERSVGTALASAGKRIFCFGNADTQAQQRPGALFGMDGVGEGRGNLDLVRLEKDAPFQRIDDPIALSQATFAESADLVVLNLGDMTRLEASRGELSTSDYNRFRAGALRRLNILISLLIERIRVENLPTSLLLVSAYPPGEPLSYTKYWHRLTPVIGWGSLFSEGVLYSRTTRTLGLIGNVDVAPTILNLLEVPQSPSMEGRPFRSIGFSGGAEPRLALLARKDYLCTLNFQGLITLTAPIFLFCAVWIVLALVAHRRNSPSFRWLSYGFVFGLNIPVALLLAPLMPPPTVWEYGLRLLAWMGGMTLLVAALVRIGKLSPLLVTLAINLLGIAIDIVTGQNLMKESMATNAALVGVRYYGIGNEYLGIFLGFALMGSFGWLEARRLSRGDAKPDKVGRVLIVLFWILCTILLGSPMWGANAGSLILCVVGFGVASLILWEKPVRWREVCLLLVFGIGVTFALSALEARLARAEASHLGASLQAATGGRGYGYLGEIVLRKIRMNLLTLFSRWYFLSLFGVSVMFWTAWRIQKEAFASMLRHYCGLQKSLLPLCVICMTALLFKDTGAMTVLFLGSSAYIILLWYTTQAPEART